MLKITIYAVRVRANGRSKTNSHKFLDHKVRKLKDVLTK